MKHILFLILLSTLTATGSEVKSQDQQKPKNSNLITVNNNRDDLFRFVLRTMITEGYTISLSDETIGVITGEKPLAGGTIKLSLFINESKIMVRGTSSMDIGQYGNTPAEISYHGMKGSPALRWWDEMNRLALLLGNDPIYERK